MGSFTSAPIIKCHDNGTLETADGITLTLHGPINKARTFDNGFPPEVSKAFLFGFPTTWDSSVGELFEDKSSQQPIMRPQEVTIFEPSSQKKTICLKSWWLRRIEKHDGNMLAVDGFTEFGKSMRIFNSSPITKRHDIYTLETDDGITIVIQGFINRARTLDNGFPPEACNKFLIGFPTTWTNFSSSSFEDNASHDHLVNSNLKNVPSTSNTSICESVTILRENIRKFVARGLTSNSIHLLLADNNSQHLLEKNICDNNHIQVDGSYGNNITCAETVDKDYEYYKADRTPVNNSNSEVHTEATGYKANNEAAGCQASNEAAGCQASNEDGLLQEKSADDAILYFIQDKTLQNSKKSRVRALTKTHRAGEGEICIGKDQIIPKASAKPARKNMKLMSPKVRDIQGSLQSYSQYLNETIVIDCSKLAPNASKNSAASQPNETSVEGSPSSNIYHRDQKFSESSAKSVRLSEGPILPSLGNVHGVSQDYSQILNETNNVKCSILAPGGSSSASKISATSFPNYSMLTDPSSPTGKTPLPSIGDLEEQQHGHQYSRDMTLEIVSESNSVFKYDSSLGACSQSLNNQRTSSCDRVVGQVQETPTNSKVITSPNLQKNMTRYSRKRKGNQRVKSRMRVKQNDCRHQKYLSTTEENISISLASTSRRKVHRTPRNHNKRKNPSILTPESLSLKRSRSGRLLIPTLDCSRRVVYEAGNFIA